MTDLQALSDAASGLLKVIDRAFEGLAIRIPNPGQRRAIVNAAERLRETLAASPSPDTAHEHDFRRTFVDGEMVDVRCACGETPTDWLGSQIIRPSPATDAGLDEDPCCERERELRDERVRTAHFHIAHDGTVRHPATCGECRRLEEQQRGAEAPR